MGQSSSSGISKTITVEGRVLDTGHYIFLAVFAILLFLILFIFLQSAHEYQKPRRRPHKLQDPIKER